MCLSTAALLLGPAWPVTAGVTDDQAFLAVLGDLVLPPTSTPGAGSPETVAFVARALSAGMDDAPTSALIAVLTALDAKAGGSFMAASTTGRLAALTALDGEAFAAPGPATHPWRIVKGLILAGFYTSDAGCMKELTYELAPGRWDYDIALKPADRAIANDWFAVSFR